MSYIGNTVQNQSYVPTVDYFSGNGSTTAFTLSHPVGSVYELEVVVNNVQQNPSSAYTVSGSTITFTSAPSSGTNNIYVYYVSPNTQIVQPGQGTVTPSSLSTGGPYWDTSSNVGIGITPASTVTLDVKQVAASTDLIVGLTAGTGARAQIRSIAQADNTSSVLALYTTSGSSTNERMRIDASGRVTAPYQPYFEAFRQTDQTGYNATSLSTTITYNLTTSNIGSNFSTSTGLFTAPVAGKYIFSASAYSSPGTFQQIWLVVNGGRADGTDWVSQTAYQFITGFFLVYLAAGDSVGVHAYNSSASSMTVSANFNHTYFKGYLLG